MRHNNVPQTSPFLLVLGLALATVALVFCARASAADDSAPAPRETTRTFRALDKLDVHYTDRDEPPEARTERLWGVADAIDAATPDRTERTALVVIAWHESRLARYVQEGRCAEGPAGPKECDSGRAKGLWQIHDAPEWQVPETEPEQAALAARIWRAARTRCARAHPDELAGAFTGYGMGGKCAPNSWATARANHLRKILAER